MYSLWGGGEPYSQKLYHINNNHNVKQTKITTKKMYAPDAVRRQRKENFVEEKTFELIFKR